MPEGNPTPSDVIPALRKAEPDDAENFALGDDTRISVPSGDKGAKAAGEYLAGTLRPATGFALPVSEEEAGGPAIVLNLDDSADAGAQSYRLDVKRERVTITAKAAGGLFNGVHTLRQLLPDEVENGSKAEREWVIAGGTIDDAPRFGYRGAMLDVARHFFGVDEVKRHIDRIAQYKINYLHLHLSDDQGWRIEIDGWPQLTEKGGKTQVGGGKGGFYTKKQFSEIVAYAQSRGVTIVPEIDMPGHTNAALNAYPELTCDGKAPPPYTDTQVGFSSLCISSKDTYRFAEDVIEQLAALTPGPYLHIGGDEADKTSDADYRKFFSRVLPMVTEAGKQPLGWHEYARAELPSDAVVQYWRIESEHGPTGKAAAGGRKVLMSPANKTYLDMKYAEGDAKGNKWAGPVSVRTAYEWEPSRVLAGVGEDAVLGVEAPLWTELVETEDDVERMAFPRTQAIAEVGWSAERDWPDFRKRLAAHGPRMKAQGIGYHPSPEIPW